MSDPVYIGYYTLTDAISMPDDARFIMYDPAGPGSYNITGALLKAQILTNPNITGNSKITGDLTVTGTTTISAGTAAAPSLTFAGDTDTGVFSAGAGSVAVSTNGTKRVEVIGTGETGIGAAPTVGQGALQVTGSQSLTGNLNFTGTGNRITGDFSNAAVANRVMFQNSVGSSNTYLSAMPNVANGTSLFRFYNNNDPDNAAYVQLYCSITGIGLASNVTGTGTLLPIVLRMGATNHALLSTNDNFLIKSNAVNTDDDSSAKLQVTGGILEKGAGGIGYGTGSGGTVTQATSKSTSVTLNKPTGRITTAADALAAGVEIGFNVNNSHITVNDTVVINTVYGGNYTVRGVVGTGLFYCYIKNISAGSLSEAIGISFAVIKGAIA